MRRTALLLTFFILNLYALSLQAAERPSRPNIVFIMADDMGWAQPGFNGGNKELTPNIDRLATQSLKLTQFYTHSVCAPTRGAFLTGRYAFRNWMDWRSEDFGKPSYLKKLGLTLAHTKKGEPAWLKETVDKVRATQPKNWPPGETPWPQAPKAPVGSL